jgi:hypothetical protein
MTKNRIVDQVFKDAKIDLNKQKDLQLIIELCHMCMDRYTKAKDEQISEMREALEKIQRIANGNNRLEDIAWRNAYHTANKALNLPSSPIK